MNNEAKKTASEPNELTAQKDQSAPKANKKKEAMPLLTFADVKREMEAIDVSKPKATEKFISLFEVIRTIKDLGNQQINEYFDFIESTLESMWLPFLSKLTVTLCRIKCDNDSKLIPEIRARCKAKLEQYGVHDTSLTSAEKNVCMLADGKYVTEFLENAQKQNSKNSEHQITNEDLARLSFICFTLYRRGYNDNAATQCLIDRAIAEFFSSQTLTGLKEKDMAGITIGNILSAKTYSSRRIAETTYLYAGVTETISAQAERITNLDEIRKSQLLKIDRLSEKITRMKAYNQDVSLRNAELTAQIEQLQAEKEAAENMLDFEKNKFEKQLESQEAGVADQLSSDIGLELLALRELVEYLPEDQQKRFRRRLDRIDRYLHEFGGE